MMSPAEERKLMNQLNAQLREDCAASERIGYSPKKFRTMMAESGPVGACVSVIMSSKIPDGFLTLFQKQALELTAEATVLRGPWKVLFEESVLDRARQRLRKYERPDLAV
jgi:hypothetical protein